MGEGMTERREFLRVAAYFPLRYRRPPDEPPTSVQMQDWSGGGIGLLLKEPFVAGTKLLLEIDLRDRGPWVSLDAEIVWSEPAVSRPSAPAWQPMSAGLKFVRVDANDPRLYRQLFPESARRPA